MMRAILGIGTKTCNEILYIELGMLSMKARVTIRQFEFWRKILEMKDENPLTHAIREAKNAKLKEIIHYEYIYNKYKCKEEIVDAFFEDIKRTIRRKASEGKSKYVTYLQINPELSFPECYGDSKHRYVSMVAKLRASSHCLRVETGRRTGTPREHRLCHCKADVEDESHFLLYCDLYADIRMKHNIRGISLVDLLNDVKYLLYIDDLMKRRSSLRVQFN